MTRRALRMVPMTLVMGTIFFLSHQPGDSLPLPAVPGLDKVAHLLVYGTLGATTLYAFGERERAESPVRTVLLTILFCLMYGMTDEFHQSFIPGRSPSIMDLAADGVGAALVGIIWLRLKKTKFFRERIVRGSVSGREK